MNIEINLSESDILLVSFGGLALELNMPIPEFKRVMTPLNMNKVFVTDENRCWYYKDMEDLIHELKKLISDMNPKYTIFFGNSAGGYAAILYGILLEVDRVMSFQGQTFLSKKSREKYNDKRWINDVVNAQKYVDDEDYLDLWNHDKKCRTIVEFFYCENFNESRIHAELFYEKTKYLNVVLNKYQCPSENLASWKRNTGELLSIFQDRIGESDGSSIE